MKALIADDEPIAVQSLVYMIKKHFPSVDIVGTARTGRQAVEKAIRLSPDLVIMDISMPGLNGLDAIRKIQEIHSSVRFLVITAYDYFDYAKESVSLGVEEFLLKPVKETKFTEAVEKIIRRIGQSQEKIREQLEQQEKLKLAVPVIEASLIRSLCLSDEADEKPEHYFRMLGIRETCGYMLILDIPCRNVQTENRNDAKNHQEKIAGKLRNLLHSCCSCIAGALTAHQIPVYVLDRDPDCGSGQRERSVRLSRQIVKKASGECPGLRIGIGRYHREIRDAGKSYRQAFHALLAMEKPDPAVSPVLHVDDRKETGEKTDPEFGQLLEEEIFSKIPNEDPEVLQAAFDRLYRRLAADDSMSLASLKNHMITFLFRFPKHWKSTAEMDYETVNQVIRAETKTELYERMRQFLNDILPSVCSEKHEKAKDIIKKADDYIEANYSRNLSLEEVAGKVNLSSYYFSRFYKEETGRNFSDKLTQIRIEKAKELLSDPDATVKDVAWRVGFADPSYFSKTFRKTTGITASNYRKQAEGGKC